MLHDHTLLYIMQMKKINISILNVREYYVHNSTHDKNSRLSVCTISLKFYFGFDTEENKNSNEFFHVLENHTN